MFVAVPVNGIWWPASVLTVMQVVARAGGTFSLERDNPWIDRARANCVNDFLLTNEPELLFIDSDTWFDPEIVTTMQAAKADVITCTYRQRNPPHKFVAATLGGGKDVPTELRNSPVRMVDGKRVVEIERDGLGCCLIQRRVIEKLCVPELEYVSTDSGRRAWNLFEYGITEVDGVRRAGAEDRAFFKRVRDAGFKVECLIDATIVHGGIAGRFADLLNG